MNAYIRFCHWFYSLSLSSSDNNTTEMASEKVTIDCFNYNGVPFATPCVNTSAFKGINKFCPDLNTLATEIMLVYQKKVEDINKNEDATDAQKKCDLKQAEVNHDKNILAFNKLCNLSQVTWNDNMNAPVYEEVHWEKRPLYFTLYEQVFPNAANMTTLEQHNAKLLEAAEKKKENPKKKTDFGNRKYVWFTQDAQGTMFDGVKTTLKDQAVRNPWLLNTENPPKACLVRQTLGKDEDRFYTCFAHPEGGFLYQEL